MAAAPAAGQAGAVLDVQREGDVYTFDLGGPALRVSALDADPANDDPADPEAPDADIVVKHRYPGGSSLRETSDAYVVSTRQARLTVTKDPLTLHLATRDGRTLWDETAPLSWDDDGTTQTLARGPREQFFGGGMQNGRFSHRGTTIAIERSYDWNDGGSPNAVPFYVSSRGYGVLRNTFAPGSYDFGTPVSTRHDEQRFDAYYFVGDAEQVIDGYTELSGRPLAVPMSALELGDADCYLHNANRGERETLRDSTAVAEGYARHRMPLGWMLVNDGYGCGYEDLPATGDMLAGHDAELGLWTEADLTEQESEVAAGVRVRKTDVAWVGPGYRFALDACEQSRDGIEDNSPDRATVLTIEGWAGTQRCGAVWSGDQSGSWDYIRWQIPTYAGSTMSGQHLATGDVDGIFGGSAETYVRDLQWKAMLPMTYAMNGWAASDKQPWRYGAPYTGINRRYLMLHERLLPYLYTHTMRATKDGVGAVKPLYLDYPNDARTWGDAVKYEFLAGDDFLVAPVYEDTTVRDGIYLPRGRWIDYWTGRVYEGPRTLNGYQAPLDTLPLFVRAGAVVPQFAPGTLDWKQGKRSHRLDLDVYPSGRNTFVNYEDDGRTQRHTRGERATQRFTVDAPRRGPGTVRVAIGRVAGHYAGLERRREYRLTVHTDRHPSAVLLARRPLPQVRRLAALDHRAGWFHDARTGVTTVATGKRGVGATSVVTLRGSSAVGGAHPRDRDATLRAQLPAISAVGSPSRLTATFTNRTGTPVDLGRLDVAAPDGWRVTPTGRPTGVVRAGGQRTVTYTVRPAADAEPGRSEVRLTAHYLAHGQRYATATRAATTLAFADLDAARDNVGTTASDEPGPGDLDGGGSSFLAEQLAEQGVEPGAEVSANGYTFTWPDVEPGTPDNVAAAGQTVRLEGRGNTLAVLGTGTSGEASGTATVHYTDGSSTTRTLGFPNWCCLETDTYGAKIAVTTHGKNTADGPAYPDVEYRLYTVGLRIDPAKDVAAVTLPGNAAVHVFAASVTTEDVVPPPVEDGQYSVRVGSSGDALAAPGNESAGQLTTAEVGAAPSQKWVLTQQADGSYQLKNAGSGLCADVDHSSTESGAAVLQYSCGSGPNQRWVVTVTDDGLRIAAKHSGLSLAALDDGTVVQQTDDGSASQRWSVVAN